MLQNASSELIKSIFLSIGYRLDKEEAGREARSVVYDQFVSADEASICSHYFIRKTEIIGGLNYATETLGITNQDASKCTSRSRQVGTVFESKAKTKRRSNAHRRHTQILVTVTAVATTIIRSVSFIEPVADRRESRTPMVVIQCENNVYIVW